MSIEAMAVSLHHSKTQGATKLVLLGIANHEGDGGAFPSISTLGKYAGGVNRRTVQRAIQELIEKGEITCQVNGGGSGDARPNLYRVVLRCPANCDGSTNHRKVEGGRSGCHGGGGLGVTGGAVWVSPEPSLEPSLEPILAQTESLGMSGVFGFLDFWDAYPRKVGKGAAVKAFKAAAKKHDVDLIVEGAKRIAADPNLPASQFVPYPATWLNREGWNDEPFPERQMTAEEKQQRDQAERARRRELDLEESRKAREESEALRKRLELNPPKRCEHDRVAVICPVCSRANVAG